MPQELINGIFIKGDPLAPHPGALISDSFLCGPCIGIELHDYIWVIFSHEPRELSPLPPGNFLLELSVFSLSQLDLSLLEERPYGVGVRYFGTGVHQTLYPLVGPH